MSRIRNAARTHGLNIACYTSNEQWHDSWAGPEEFTLALAIRMDIFSEVRETSMIKLAEVPGKKFVFVMALTDGGNA